VPLTIAHPVAAIPLRRPLGRLGVLTALVIGSIMPDVPLFLPVSLNRNLTHSAFGLLWFCLPVGVLSYLLYDRVLDRPLRALMPEALQRRLPPSLDGARPPVWAPAVLVSLLVGAATHAAWDSFTHGGDAGVGEWLPVLETRLFRVSGYTVYVFSVLQHASSAVGTAVLALWIWRWYRRAPENALPVGGLTPAARRWLLVSIALAVLLATTAAGASRPPAQPTLRALQPVARRLVVTALSTLVGSITLYAIGWHWMRSRLRTWGPPPS
jgi:uncharacterized protein DUF4184